jgi:hypothetical protein
MIMVARMAIRDIATLLESGSAFQVNRVIVCTMPFADAGSDLAMGLHPLSEPTPLFGWSRRFRRFEALTPDGHVESI